MILNESLTSLSGRVRLAPPSESDDAFFATVRCHPETRRYLPFFPAHCTPDDARARRLSREPNKAIVDFSIYALTPGSPPKYAGNTTLFNIDETFKTGETGACISPELFGQGIATDALHTVLTYAFEERKLHRVVFQTAAYNVRMRSWLERFGATLEGTLREGWADGEGGYMDGCLYSILEHEWRQNVKAKLEGRMDLGVRA
ncbi:Acyl-CoA N-acyltransferase [Mycena venus]|uniref:Acyl-CoA N-acyltransferase n=1 Tax=Mycena venus TaxID=2733690 RepID=A0A8H7D624_9AGAR|nr:Acyl-CoA N-acyltransferase [Mycena venus]